jgi:hypothetical protein
MALTFRAGMSAYAFVVNGLYQYLQVHEGREPAELALHPKHRRVLLEELQAPQAGVVFDGCEFNGIAVIEDPCCRTPWLVNDDGERWEL